MHASPHRWTWPDICPLGSASHLPLLHQNLPPACSGSWLACFFHPRTCSETPKPVSSPSLSLSGCKCCLPGFRGFPVQSLNHAHGHQCVPTPFGTLTASWTPQGDSWLPVGTAPPGVACLRHPCCPWPVCAPGAQPPGLDTEVQGEPSLGPGLCWCLPPPAGSLLGLSM